MKLFTQIFSTMIVLLLGATGAFAAELRDIRFGPSPEKTRIVFDLSAANNYEVGGDTTGNGRLLIEFDKIQYDQKLSQILRAKGHVATYTLQKQGNGRVRAVFALKKSSKIKEIFEIEPSAANANHRLVIDLTNGTRSEFLASLPRQYPDLGAVIEKATATPAQKTPVNPTRQREATLAPSLKPVTQRIIVIDPGHGGKDPGAQGQSGTFEKTVNLKAALKLKEILEKRRGYKVVLTRSDDRYIALDKREALARDANADLFISLHADALAAKAVRGASVYTLSDAGSARSAALAKKEGNYRVYNLDVATYGEEVGDILFDLAQGTTNNASSRFAEILIDNLSGKTQLLNRSHRTADLRVLLAPDVPAILFEMAFLSNAKDESNLNSKVWRARTMNATADAIDAYFAEIGPRRFAAGAAQETN